MRSRASLSDPSIKGGLAIARHTPIQHVSVAVPSHTKIVAVAYDSIKLNGPIDQWVDEIANHYRTDVLALYANQTLG